MYPPPSKEITERLTGNVLVLVSYGRYVLHLVFDSGNKLSISGPFRYAERQSIAGVPVCEFPLGESDVIRSLGHSINGIQFDADGTMEVEFSNGDLLIAYANDPAYEAYTLWIDGKEYLV